MSRLATAAVVLASAFTSADVGRSSDLPVDASVVTAILATGATVNGVVFDGDEAVVEYYRREVVSGVGSFILVTSEAPTLLEAMRRKLVLDLMAVLDSR